MIEIMVVVRDVTTRKTDTHVTTIDAEALTLTDSDYAEIKAATKASVVAAVRRVQAKAAVAADFPTTHPQE